MAKDKKMSSQLDAIERSMPRAYEIEEKVTVTSSMLEEIKDWKVGEEYEIKIKVKQLSSDMMMDGDTKAQFEIMEVEKA